MLILFILSIYFYVFFYLKILEMKKFILHRQMLQINLFFFLEFIVSSLKRLIQSQCQMKNSTHFCNLTIFLLKFLKIHKGCSSKVYSKIVFMYGNQLILNFY
jgi:hypothetical protein